MCTYYTYLGGFLQYYEAGNNWLDSSPDKTETHVETILANVFSRELLQTIISGFSQYFQRSKDTVS